MLTCNSKNIAIKKENGPNLWLLTHKNVMDHVVRLELVGPTWMVPSTAGCGLSCILGQIYEVKKVNYIQLDTPLTTW